MHWCLACESHFPPPAGSIFDACAQPLTLRSLPCRALTALFMGWRFPELRHRWSKQFSIDNTMKNWGIFTSEERRKKFGGRMPAWKWLEPTEMTARDWQGPGLERAIRRPLLLKNTPVKRWPTASWTAEHIGAVLGGFSNAYSHSKPFFLHHQTGGTAEEPGRMPPDGWKPPYSLVNCTARCFLDGSSPLKSPAPAECGGCKGQADGRYLYWSSPVGRDSPLWTAGARDRLADLTAKDKPAPSANLWVAGPGVTTAAHYDSFHNMLVQLSGKKKVVLLPPSAAAALGTYPRPHPSHRQARFDLSAVISEESVKPLMVLARPAPSLAPSTLFGAAWAQALQSCSAVSPLCDCVATTDHGRP